jgi:hypothetical protein
MRNEKAFFPCPAAVPLSLEELWDYISASDASRVHGKGDPQAVWRCEKMVALFLEPSSCTRYA